MEYKFLVLIANLLCVIGGYLLGRDNGRRATLIALDKVVDRIIDDVEHGRSLDWARQDSEDYK